MEEQGEMTETGVRDALDSVSKDNFGDSQSTEWSIVMNQETKELIYYHRENYGRAYVVPVELEKVAWAVPICQNTWQEGGNYELFKNFIGFIQIKKEC